MAKVYQRTKETSRRRAKFDKICRPFLVDDFYRLFALTAFEAAYQQNRPYFDAIMVSCAFDVK
jgi:hypothetical protein